MGMSSDFVLTCTLPMGPGGASVNKSRNAPDAEQRSMRESNMQTFLCYHLHATWDVFDESSQPIMRCVKLLLHGFFCLRLVVCGRRRKKDVFSRSARS